MRLDEVPKYVSMALSAHGLEEQHVASVHWARDGVVIVEVNGRITERTNALVAGVVFVPAT